VAVFLLSFQSVTKKIVTSSKSIVGVERDVATRVAQIVWPMITVINFKGFTGHQKKAHMVCTAG
jgi:hypothetical protein